MTRSWLQFGLFLRAPELKTDQLEGGFDLRAGKIVRRMPPRLDEAVRRPWLKLLGQPAAFGVGREGVDVVLFRSEDIEPHGTSLEAGASWRAGIRAFVVGLAFGRCDQAFADRLLARRLAAAAHGLALLARRLLRRLLVEAPALHLAEHSLALHFLLQDAKRLVDIIVADKNLHETPWLLEERRLTALSRGGAAVRNDAPEQTKAKPD